jgi:hypothetical protein
VSDNIYTDNIHRLEQFGQQVRNAFSKELVGLTRDYARMFAHHTPDIVLNSNGYRSDEFITEHDGKHILFSGCSNTFGLGLTREEMWSSKLLSRLESSGQEVSGNFNIAYPGSGVFEIVSNTIRYCNLYGMPDAIFVQILDMARFYDIDDRNPDQVKNVTLTRSHKNAFMGKLLKQLEIHNYQYLMMLEAFCKAKNIDLFILSWKPGKYFEESVDLENFYEGDVEDMAKSISSYIDRNPKDEFALTARDRIHPGNGQQEYWADFGFNLYNKSVKEKNVN